MVEVSIINKNETLIFPTSEWKITICDKDNEPPHFQILKDGWNVLFLISNGELYQIETKGNNNDILQYMCNNIEKWLNSKCAIIPKITNRENAEVQWLQMHSN